MGRTLPLQVVSHSPMGLPQTVVTPLLSPQFVHLMSREATEEENKLWQSLGDAWNIPRLDNVGHISLLHLTKHIRGLRKNLRTFWLYVVELSVPSHVTYILLFIHSIHFSNDFLKFCLIIAADTGGFLYKQTNRF